MPIVASQSPSTLGPRAKIDIRFKWTTSDIQRLLQLIKDYPEYRATFFETGLVQRIQWRIARELLLDLVRGVPHYLEALEAKGLISKDGLGSWKILEEWDSRVNNPATKKLGTLRMTYQNVRADHNIRSAWTDFSDLPEDTAGDFQRKYPWYFQFKELESPHRLYQAPPIRLSITQPASTSSHTSVPATTRDSARHRPGAPPSPPLSVYSSSPSPSPVASFSRISFTPRPNPLPRLNITRLAQNGPQPHVRPNALASSSQIPIVIDSSSSESSSDTASESETNPDPAKDIESVPSDEVLDLESVHEMENDHDIELGPASVEPSSPPQAWSFKYDGQLNAATGGPQTQSLQMKRRLSSSSLELPPAGPSKRSNVMSAPTLPIPIRDDPGPTRPSTSEELGQLLRKSLIPVRHCLPARDDDPSATSEGSEAESAAREAAHPQVARAFSFDARICRACLDGRQARVSEHKCSESQILRKRLHAAGKSAKRAAAKTAPHPVFEWLPTWLKHYQGASTGRAKSKILDEARFLSFVTTVERMHTLGMLPPHFGGVAISLRARPLAMQQFEKVIKLAGGLFCPEGDLYRQEPAVRMIVYGSSGDARGTREEDWIENSHGRFEVKRYSIGKFYRFFADRVIGPTVEQRIVINERHRNEQIKKSQRKKAKSQVRQTKPRQTRKQRKKQKKHNKAQKKQSQEQKKQKGR